MSLKKAKAFDASRPSQKKPAPKFDPAAFVEGKEGKERQNLWLDADLRTDVAIQARKNKESISAFADRALRRELKDPSGPGRS